MGFRLHAGMAEYYFSLDDQLTYKVILSILEKNPVVKLLICKKNGNNRLIMFPSFPFDRNGSTSKYRSRSTFSGKGTRLILHYAFS